MKTFLNWSAYKDAGMGDAYADIPKHGGDWAKAIAVCINSKQCESDGKGVMCPSYRVSAHPNLSPGGRVKLLKAALGDNPETLFDPELVEAMDLCVSCKGCKRECENNVDMALIKAEYLAQYRNKYGVSLRSYLLAHMPRWLFYAPWLRHLIRLRNRFSAVAWLTEKLVGFTAGVPLPVPVARRYRGNSSAASEDADFEVILLVDTFSRYFEPEVPTAAVALLTDFGYRVAELELPPGERPLCCGRTYLAQGMVAEARTEAERLLEALLPYCREGKTVIGLEASCVLHLRDDIHALGLADKAMPVLERLLLLEEFLAREIKAGRVCSAFAEVDGKTLVHGHCQQKAAGAMKSVRRVLKEIPAHDFDMIESSCCGMAGSFGLESEHHHLSEAMAENSLLPALREQEHHHLIVNGFSCRHQIRSSSDEYPEHLAVFLRDRQKAKTVVAD